MPQLEDALASHEKRVDVALKHALQVASTLKGWKKATVEGNFNDRHRLAEKARELSAQLADPVHEAADSWNFDLREYLSSEAWREELMEAAQQADHRLFSEGEGIVSSPVVMSADPQRVLLRIGKTRWARLRPSVVVTELKKLRARGEKQKAIQESLDALYGASKFLDKQPGPDGSVKAKLRDIYDLFSLTPGWKKENPEASFAQDLYVLHRSEVRVTRGEKKYEFEFPTGQPKARDLFEVVDESGRPIRYYMIHFR